MAVNLFKLVGSIYVDNDEANKSLAKTDEQAEKTGSKLSGVGKAAAAMGAAAVAATGAAVKALKNQADETAAAADVVDKGSQKMGISAEEYQKLAYAADLSGTSMQTMQKAAQKLQAAGSELDVSQALDQLYKIEDADKRAAAAHEMFGDKVANELAPMLNAGKEGMAAMKKEAEDLGLVMSDDAVKNGAAYQDAMTALNDSFDAVKNTIGSAVIPIFTSIAKIITENMPTIKKLIEDLAPILADMIAELVPLVAEIMPLIIDLLPTVIDLAKTIVPPILELAKVVIPYLIEVVNALMPVFENIIEFISNIFSGNFEAALDNIFGIIYNWGEAIKTVITKPLNWIIDKINTFIGYLNKLEIPDWVPVVGGKSINIPTIPKLKVGLDYVPADNYPALLHKGEQVLTAEEAFAYKQGGNSADMSALINEMRELRMMFKDGTAKTSSNISNTREMKKSYA